MTEKIASIWDALNNFLTSKINSAVAAGSVIVTAEATKQDPYVNLAESGFLWFTWAGWFQVIACIWLLILISEKIGLFKLIAWALSRRKNISEG